MYKLIISTFSMFLLNTLSLHANSKSYSFVGVDTTLSHYNDGFTPSLGIKYGKQVDMLRTTIGFTHAQKSGDTLQTFMLEVDKGLSNAFFQQAKLHPYVGFNYGFVRHDSSDKGYSYGLSGGITYILNHSMDLNLGLQMLKVSKVKDFNDLNNINLSLHYFY